MGGGADAPVPAKAMTNDDDLVFYDAAKSALSKGYLFYDPCPVRGLNQGFLAL